MADEQEQETQKDASIVQALIEAMGGLQTSTSTKSGVSYNFTSKEDARASFRKAMVDMYGYYDANAFNAFYSGLTKLEKKYATRYSGTTTTGYSFNPTSFMTEYLQGLAPAIIATGKYGGAARQTIDELASYADSMGLNYNKSVFAKDMQSLMKGERSPEDILNSYRESSMQLYSGFAERLQQNPKLTMKDLAAPYVNTMASLLEVDPGTLSLTNPTLQGALSTSDGKTKPISEFIKDVKNMDAWKFTNNAKEEAVSLARSFKQSFGFGA